MKKYLKTQTKGSTYNDFSSGILGGGGQNTTCDRKFSEKCPCSYHNNTALIKQISLFDTAIVMIKFLFRITKNYTLTNKEV